VRALSGLDGSAKRLWCWSLQLLVEALFGRVFVRMGRNMYRKSEGLVESMSPWFAVADWTLSRVCVFEESAQALDMATESRSLK
jgi:hypothetical protein